MNFKEWLRLWEGLYGTSAAGPVPAHVKPDGVVSWDNLNDGGMGRSRFQSTDGKMKKKKPMRGLAGFN